MLSPGVPFVPSHWKGQQVPQRTHLAPGFCGSGLQMLCWRGSLWGWEGDEKEYGKYG